MEPYKPKPGNKLIGEYPPYRQRFCTLTKKTNQQRSGERKGSPITLIPLKRELSANKTADD